MGKLVNRKSKLTFETADEVRERGKYRSLIITAHPLHAEIRLKGMRQSLTVSWEGIRAFAAKKEAERVRAAKKASRQPAI